VSVAVAKMPRVVVVGFGATMVLYWPTLVGLVRVWRPEGSMTHGWVIAALTVWLVWRDAFRLHPADDGWEPVALPLAGLSLLWLAASVMDIQVGYTGAFPLVLFGWALIVFGPRVFSAMTIIAATAFLAVPLWEIVVRPLQFMTILVSGIAVKLMGIDAVVRGDTITIQYGTFIIEHSCAGLAYFVTGLVVGALYAHLFMRSRVGMLAVVGVAAAIAILSNWFRVTSLIVIGEVTQMQSELVANHGTYGWVVFSIALIPYFFLARWIERREATRLKAKGAPEAEERVPTPATDPDLSRRVFLATASAGLGPALFLTYLWLPTAPVEPTLSLIPESGWEQAMEATSDLHWEIEFPTPDAEAEAVWTKDGTRVSTRHLVYDEQSQGRELIGYLSRIAPDSLLISERTVGPLDARGRTVREAWVAHPDGGTTLVWYWYRVGGYETASAPRAKLLELPAFFSRRRQAELLVASTPCGPEECQGAAEALFSFVGGDPTRLRFEGS
jgi:EpsI family protein